MKRERITQLKKAAAGTLSNHDVPDADVTQPAKPAKLIFFDATDYTRRKYDESILLYLNRE